MTPRPFGIDATAGNRFPRAARLLDTTAFARVFARPTRSADTYFTVLARRRDDGAGPRLGLAIARKQARRAVDRNRLKRLVRESFRQQGARICALDLVVMCRREAVAADNQTLSRSLHAHWQRLRDRLCASSST